MGPRRRTSRYGRGNAVVAIWADGRTRELAEARAVDGALYVIEGYDDDVIGWAVRTDAVNIAQPDVPPDLPDLAPEARKAVDFILCYGGYKNFSGGTEKEQVVRSLRQMVSAGHRPTPEALELYAVASGKAGHRGVQRLLTLYEGVLQGRQFRDYARRLI